MRKAKILLEHISELDKFNFFSKVDLNGPLPDQTNSHYSGLGNCHIWTGSKCSKGYGIVRIKTNKRIEATHRVAWVIANGDFEGSLFVLHKCDNPACVRPEHLWLGTNQENMNDMMKKKRDNKASGEKHGTKTHPDKVYSGEDHWTYQKPEKIAKGEDQGSAKLKEYEVLEIRRLYNSNEMNQPALGRKFNVTQGTISGIVLNKSWKHLV